MDYDNSNRSSTLYERACNGLTAYGKKVDRIKEEWFMARPKLFVCGGGHVSCELVKIAAGLDFSITVLDDRPEFANKERFKGADQVICDSFDRLEQYLEKDAYYVVVSRGHKNDLHCVQTILRHSYRYLGMIGSRIKVAQTFDHLREAGFSEEQIGTVHAPIGLSIGAVTPAEIAISILAQIIQVKNSGFVASVSKELLACQKKGILCIIVEKKGSTPRNIGSMMLVTKEDSLDSIGGGPIEYEAILDARSCQEVMIREYRLTNEDSRGLGMICGGSNKVLFIPLD